MKSQLKNALPYFLLGALAGFVNGFLGTGGGIVQLFASYFLRRGRQVDTRDLLASTTLVTLILSAVSAVIYFRQGNVDAAALPAYLIPALCGGALGASLMERVPTVFLEKLFALLVMVAGTLRLFR